MVAVYLSSTSCLNSFSIFRSTLALLVRSTVPFGQKQSLFSWSSSVPTAMLTLPAASSHVPLRHVASAGSSYGQYLKSSLTRSLELNVLGTQLSSPLLMCAHGAKMGQLRVANVTFWRCSTVSGSTSSANVER